MVLTCQCVEDLEDAPMVAWGARWEAVRRKGGPRVYIADKRRTWAVDWGRSVSEANVISVQRTYTEEPVLEPLHGLAEPR